MCIYHKETTIKTLRELADAIEKNECPRDTLLFVVNSLLGVVNMDEFTDSQGHTYPIAKDVNENAVYHSIVDPWEEEPGYKVKDLLEYLNIKQGDGN